MTAKIKLTKEQKAAFDYSIRCVATAAQVDDRARKCSIDGDNKEALRLQVIAFTKAYDAFVGLMDDLGLGGEVDKALDAKFGVRA